ncbi:MAG: hypothetical protein ABI851_13390 [Saprospiraceae bacterium]
MNKIKLHSKQKANKTHFYSIFVDIWFILRLLLYITLGMIANMKLTARLTLTL